MPTLPPTTPSKKAAVMVFPLCWSDYIPFIFCHFTGSPLSLMSNFELLVLAFKTLLSSAPSYISDLILLSPPTSSILPQMASPLSHLPILPISDVYGDTVHFESIDLLTRPFFSSQLSDPQRISLLHFLSDKEMCFPSPAFSCAILLELKGPAFPLLCRLCTMTCSHPQLSYNPAISAEP